MNVVSTEVELAERTDGRADDESEHGEAERRPEDLAPLRARGVLSVSQARAPDHVTALATPCASRVTPSSSGERAKANAIVASARVRRPITTVRFGPMRAAISPAGIPPIIAPAP